MYKVELQGSFTMPVNQMWQKWTEPDLMMNWFQPAGMHLGQAMRNLCINGKYRFKFSAPDNSEQVLLGKYQKITENQHLAFSWQWQDEDHNTQVEITLIESQGENCELRLVHSGFLDEEDKDLHEQAWLGCLERLSLAP